MLEISNPFVRSLPVLAGIGTPPVYGGVRVAGLDYLADFAKTISLDVETNSNEQNLSSYSK